MKELYSGFATDLIFPHQDLPEECLASIGAEGETEQHIIKAKAVKSLLLGIYGEYFPIQEVLNIDVLAQAVLQAKIFPFFFVVDNQVVGTASIMPNGGGSAEFGRMAVKREFWGKGIGDLLLNARYTFAKVYAETIQVDWIYCHARSANRRIQQIWLHSPHNLMPVGISAYYTLGLVEFSTIFIKPFRRINEQQRVDCVPEARPLVEEVCGQFRHCSPDWAPGDRDDLDCPADYLGYYHKHHIRSGDFDLSTVGDDQINYVEVWCPTTVRHASSFQRQLIEMGFVPNAFYPSCNGYPPYLTFGRRRPTSRVRGANFPKELADRSVGRLIHQNYDSFCGDSAVVSGDPFV